MNKLKAHYGSGARAVGNNATEIYTTKKSEFWLSPSYGYDVIRIDFKFFEKNLFPKDLKDFYKQYWELFDDVKVRCHWGKYIPDNYGEKVENLYPKYKDWMAIRRQMDPRQVYCEFLLIIMFF
jgi:hypothetical protein